MTDENESFQRPEKGFDAAPRQRPSVLCVGGTDPTGGAGLLVDQQVLGHFGVLGSGAVSAVTVQTSAEVSEVIALPASTVGSQIDAACAEGAPSCIKTGMLAGFDTVLALAKRIERLGSLTKLVVDPVLVSSSGRRLLDLEGRQALWDELIPRAALVTPNVPEAEALTGVQIRSVSEMGRAIDLLLAQGASAVLLKGGHLPQTEEEESEVVDVLRTLDGDELRLVRPRLGGPGFRGTGCALATAIAALLAEGHTLAAAVTRAGDWLHAAMKLTLLEATPGRSPLRLSFGVTLGS